MKYLFYFYLFCLLVIPNTIHTSENISSSCGIDRSPMTTVYEGYSKIEYYPWMGYLLYPLAQKRFSTAVVLVSRSIVIASANEVDKLPKKDFRKHSKVVLGHVCNSSRGINVREYVYHPNFKRSSYSELALIQLDVDRSTEDLTAICTPPTHFINPEIYAMSFGNNCRNSRIKIHKMSHVDLDECKEYYRKSGLNMRSLWPRHTVCASTFDNSSCVWRGGTLLVVKQGEKWHLLGFGVYGPGCSEPARFIDYGMYHSWVKTSIARSGRPAVSKIQEDWIVLRRTLKSVQRFGPCDEEETEYEIYTDYDNVTVTQPPFIYRTIRYNVTLITGVEYSCVVFRIIEEKYLSNKRPKLHLRRWCAGPREMCHDFQYLQIDFYVEIKFAGAVAYKMSAYGRQAEAIDPRRATERANNWSRTYPPVSTTYDKEVVGYDAADEKNNTNITTTTPVALLRREIITAEAQ